MMHYARVRNCFVKLQTMLLEMNDEERQEFYEKLSGLMIGAGTVREIQEKQINEGIEAIKLSISTMTHEQRTRAMHDIYHRLDKAVVEMEENNGGEN